MVRLQRRHFCAEHKPPHRRNEMRRHDERLVSDMEFGMTPVHPAAESASADQRPDNARVKFAE